MLSALAKAKATGGLAGVGARAPQKRHSPLPHWKREIARAID
jgi:hypothetical protein